jgi:hypothetical protein
MGKEAHLRRLRKILRIAGRTFGADCVEMRRRSRILKDEVCWRRCGRRLPGEGAVRARIAACVTLGEREGEQA